MSRRGQIGGPDPDTPPYHLLCHGDCHLSHLIKRLPTYMARCSNLNFQTCKDCVNEPRASLMVCELG